MTSESDHIYTCDSYLATAFTFRLIDFESFVEEEIEDTETEYVYYKNRRAGTLYI